MRNADRNRATRRTSRGKGRPAWVVAAVLALLFNFPGLANGQAIGPTPSAVTEQLFDTVNGSVCTVAAIAQDGTHVSRGSGFVLRDSGLLVTNAHVISGLQRATARCGGRQYDIRRIVKFDRDVDLAVGDIGAVDLPGLSLADGIDIRPGTVVYVFGSPHGLEGTITPGLASGQRTLQGRSYIQISAPISAGSSGGPVTDERGNVIGIAVASLEVAQNINFAIPAAALAELPDVDMQPADLAEERAGVITAPVVGGASRPERRAVPTGTGAFRGNAFGSPCGEVAAAEYERQRKVGPGRGATRFDKWFGGTLELDVHLLGTPATVFYDCDERDGMTSGYYRIRGHTDGVDRIEGVLQSKYGSGIARPITEAEAKVRGCLFNFSLPGSRFYRPSKWKTWRVSDRFHVDLLVCGGKSTMTFLTYSDPVLRASASESQSASPDEYRTEASDL